MKTSLPKITLSKSQDIPFNKLVLSQANVRQIKAGISVEKLAEDIARRGLLQSLSVNRLAKLTHDRRAILTHLGGAAI